ncbi:MAG TPA: hypothetical protein VFS20_15215 [Longimicrobium sp.]|nr:hypothetical protein [Longimicrobium sp.]
MAPATLRLVRFAMLTMLLLFVGVTWFVHRNAPPDPSGAANLSSLRWVGFGLCVAAIVAMAVLRGVRQRAPVEARGTYGLIGSAFGEAAALFGGVYYFLGGDLVVFAIGLLVFLLSWGILPADPEAL